MMRITYSIQGEERVFEHETSQVIIGRHKEGIAIDLAPDLKVSRMHARIFVEDSQYWIEDLDSKQGTNVNGEEIKGQGKRLLHPGDIIEIGDATLKVHIPAEQIAVNKLLSFSASAKSLADSGDILDATN